MTVRIRGIYATALTAHLDDVVQPSTTIEGRADADLPADPAAVRIETTDDRQGVAVHGEPECVAAVADSLAELARDTFRWEAALPLDGVFAGEVTDTLGGGALVDLGEASGFLPYGATSRRIETGDRLRVQVAEAAPPWLDDRPVLATDVRLRAGHLDLVRGANPDAAAGPSLVDVLPADPPDGWGPDWAPGAESEGHDALAAALEATGERARALDASLADADAPTDRDPGPYWTETATAWLWFGRESRFALDELRRELAPTMTGHHRLKAAAERASPAVDFVEAVCPDATAEFPFDAATRQFGPTEGDRIAIGHGKPDGRRLELGPGEVVEREPDGSLTIHREMSPSGTYDALGIEREAGDVAITTITEGRWWYPTVYRSDGGDRRGTYVNVCTPVEVFPEEVRYVDLHVDVVKHGDGTVERVDDDELDDAEERGHVSEPLAARARDVASAVESAL